MMEVIEQINAVRRRVGQRILDAGEAHSVIISQVYAAPIDDVWDACTNPVRIPRWFLPVTGDLRPGGRYQLEGNASGTVERCDPPREFTATWEFGGQTSWIEVRLTSEPQGATRLELEHIADPGTPWAEFGPGAVGVGWDMALMGLATHLASGLARRSPGRCGLGDLRPGPGVHHAEQPPVARRGRRGRHGRNRRPGRGRPDPGRLHRLRRLAQRRPGGQPPSAGSSTKTGIVREVRSWYSAYGG